MEVRRLGEEFEKLCDELLRAIGYSTELQWRPAPEWPQAADILAYGKGDRLAIDLKVVPSNPASLSDLRDTVARSKALLSLVDRAGNHVVMLSCTAEPDHLIWAESTFAIKVWDRVFIERELRRLSSKHADLKKRFKKFFGDLAEVEKVGETARALAEEQGAYVLKAETGVFRLSGGSVNFVGAARHDPEHEGDRLRKKLAALPPGREDAKAYEALVQEIVFYLFGEFLVDPRPQSRTEDGLDILDLVYRVRCQ